MTVLVRGEGVAAACCARLLEEGGIRVAFETLDRPKVPAIMLGESAQKLLADVFNRPDLFSGLARIRKRVVLWGERAEPLTLPHSAVVVSEQALLDRIQPQSSPEHVADREQIDWTIHTARPLPVAAVEHRFGSRMATASAVKLKAGTDREACWVESLKGGWLFLLPAGADRAWLLSVGDATEAQLSKSRLVAEQIADMGPTMGSFPASPRIADPLGGLHWLACGTGGMAFDPLCGDGVGNAAREAILAAAVIQAAVAGADVESLVAHYRTRLAAGFQRHLQVCREFYSQGHRGPWWDGELREIERGLQWCGGRLAGAGAFQYRLNGFALERV